MLRKFIFQHGLVTHGCLTVDPANEAIKECTKRISANAKWLIVFLGVTCVVFALVSMWKENRFGWPLRGMVVKLVTQLKLLRE